MKWMSFVLLVGALAGCSAASVPSSQEACAQTVRDYAVLRDEGPAETYADVFTADAVFELGGVVTQGRDALIARHVAANAAAVWRHNMTDIRIEETDEGIFGRSRFIVMTGPHLNTESAEVAREIVGDYEDIFAIEGEQCKIASRKVSIVFDTLYP